MKRFFFFAFLFAVIFACGVLQARDRDGQGELKIRNDTDIDFYIVIDDINQGHLSARDSREYKVPMKEIKVVAEYGNSKMLVKYFKFGRGNYRDEWTINSSEVEEYTKSKNRWDY